MGHRWTRNLTRRNTERWSIQSVTNMAVFATLMILKFLKTVGGSVLLEVGKKMEGAHHRSSQRLEGKGMIAEEVRKLWKKHVADYCQGFPQCFDCNRINCERCNVPRDSNSKDRGRGFIRLVRPEFDAPGNQFRCEGVKEQKMIQVRYYKGFGVIDGGKELLPDNRKTHGFCKTPKSLQKNKS